MEILILILIVIICPGMDYDYEENLNNHNLANDSQTSANAGLCDHNMTPMG